MLVYPQAVTRKDPTDILGEIDKKLLKQAKALRNSYKFGTPHPNCNSQNISTVIVLRDVFYSKINNADWLCDYPLDLIVSTIKKALRKL